MTARASACVGDVMMINDLLQTDRRTDGPPHIPDDVRLSVMTDKAALCQCKVEELLCLVTLEVGQLISRSHLALKRSSSHI